MSLITDKLKLPSVLKEKKALIGSVGQDNDLYIDKIEQKRTFC